MPSVKHETPSHSAQRLGGVVHYAFNLNGKLGRYRGHDTEQIIFRKRRYQPKRVAINTLRAGDAHRVEVPLPRQTRSVKTLESSNEKGDSSGKKGSKKRFRRRSKSRSQKKRRSSGL